MDRMPGFRLMDENGESLDSAFLEGMAYVLCFVPDLKEESCRILNDFDNIYPKLMIRNTPTMAVIPAEPQDILAVRERFGLRIKLLSDKDGELAGQCGVDGTGAVVVGRD